jgi:hypothetical protein
MPYDMDAAFMLLKQHERGIHALTVEAHRDWP